jgi:hypothetical protein
MTNEDQPQIRSIIADARQEFAISAQQLEAMSQPQQSSRAMIAALETSPAPKQLP